MANRLVCAPMPEIRVFWLNLNHATTGLAGAGKDAICQFRLARIDWIARTAISVWLQDKVFQDGLAGSDSFNTTAQPAPDKSDTAGYPVPVDDNRLPCAGRVGKKPCCAVFRGDAPIHAQRSCEEIPVAQF